MKQPNIVVFYIDDMGYKDIGVNGSEFYETPHIDRLANEAMVFQNAYAASPVCSPSRASFMSGKYPARLGVTQYLGAGVEKGKVISCSHVDHLSLDENSLAKVLKENGYATWHVGKWHLGDRRYYPENHGFDVNVGGCEFGHPKQGYFSPYGIETLPDGIDGEYLTDRLTNEAIELIKNEKDKPFYLNLWHYAVHTPIQAKEEDVLYFKEKAKRLGLDKLKAFEEGEYFPADHQKHQRVKRRIIQSDPHYAALIYNLDYNIGRVIETLKETNNLDDTIIIFSSDNGGLSTSEGSPTCNLPLSEGKGWMYEGGLKVPFFVYWPNVVKPGSTCLENVITPDLYPTILEMAKIPLIPNQHVDGCSLMPLLKGGSKLSREAIYWHYPNYGNQGGVPSASVLCGNFKLIKSFENNEVKLIDIENDISEKHDLSNDLHDDTMRLNQLLNQWLEDLGALIPIENKEYLEE